MTDSIWYYKGPGEFKHLIRTQADKSILVSDMIAGWREAIVLPKKLGNLSVQQLSDDTKLIAQVQEALKKMPAESKYKLPYKKEQRQQEIIESIAESIPIDKKNTKCKVITECYKDDKTGQQFPFVVEIAIAPRKDLGVSNAGEVTFIGSVNDTPGIDGGERYFQSDQYAYRWTDRNGSHSKNSAREVLAESGFNGYWGTSRRRVPSVVYINVKTNVPDWLGSAGKTHMNQIPYGDTIAKALSTMSHKIPSYRGQGYAAMYEPQSSYHKSMEDYRAEFLGERRRQIEANPSLRETDRLTQRGSWYRVRPRMVEDGFIPRKNWGVTGKSFADGIRDACKELWPDENITREYLGIYAKARGMLYFKGHKFPIEYESIDDLASKAPINVVIEKDGVPSVLEPYADKYGVALVSTQGNFVDYVKDFIRAAMEDNESVVVTLLDDDKVGHDMAKSTQAISIGVGKEAVLWLKKNGYPDLKLEDVQEEYSPDGYTTEYRIEIDAILAEVGAEGLWKYVMHKVEELKPFDLTKSVHMPTNEVLHPEEVSESLSLLNEYVEDVTKSIQDKIEDDLRNASKLCDVKQKEKEVIETLADTVAEDEGMRLIVSIFAHVCTQLRKLVGGDK